MRSRTLAARCALHGTALATLATLFCGGATTARAESKPRLDLAIAGGSVIPLEDFDSIGNAYGGSVALRLSAFRFGFGFGGVLPDARPQGHLGAFWGECTWYVLPLDDGTDRVWAPYVIGAVGLITDDGDPGPDPDGIEPARWNLSGPDPLFTLGGGVRYGPARGLYLQVDVRQHNIRHAGLSLGAGYSF